MVVREQYIQPGFYVAVLESIVKKYDVGGYAVFQIQELADSFHTLGADGYGNVREFLFYLIRFVANIVGGAFRMRYEESFLLPLVSSAQNRHPVMLGEQLYEIFRMGCLPRAPNGDIPDTNDGNIKTDGLEYAFVKKEIPYVYSQSVKTREGE